MKCEEIQLKLLEDPENADVREHLAACPRCSSFATLASGLTAAGSDEFVRTPSLASIVRLRNARTRRNFLRIFATAVAAAFVFGIAPTLMLARHTAARLPENAEAALPSPETDGLYAASDAGELEFSWDMDGLDMQSDFESFQTAVNWNISEL